MARRTRNGALRSGIALEVKERRTSIRGAIALQNRVRSWTSVADDLGHGCHPRVVEVLLATIRPWQLLLGKVLGIGAAGLVQLLVLGAVGIGIGTATGVISLTATAVAVFAATLGWFLLGFLFFALLYAAAGALVSRQEDVNTVSTPMTILIIIPFLIGISSVQNPDSGLAATLSWIPPFSPILMPIQQATGETEPGLTVLAVVLMLAAIALVTWLGGRIYANAVLRMGSRVRLAEALRASR